MVRSGLGHLGIILHRGRSTVRLSEGDMTSFALSRPMDNPEQTHADYERLLNEIAQLLTLDVSPEMFSQSVFDVLCEPFRLDFCFYFLVSEDETHLELASSSGNRGICDGVGRHLEFGEAISGTVAETKEEAYRQFMQ